MLTYRAVFSVLLSILYLNRKLKYVVWDSLERKNYFGLALKIIHGQITTIVIYSALYFWPLTMQSTVRSLTPFLVVIISKIFLKEGTDGQ